SERAAADRTARREPRVRHRVRARRRSCRASARRSRVGAGRAGRLGDAGGRPQEHRVNEIVEGVQAYFQVRDAWRVAADVVDVLLVAYLFYRGLLLIRGTRAMQMVVGLVLVFLVYQLSRRAELTTLFTILDELLTYVILIVVVLFQNDIRRALMRVGSRPFLRGA